MSTNRTNRQAKRSTSFFEPLESRQLMSGGELDPTFAGDGAVGVRLVGDAT